MGAISQGIGFGQAVRDRQKLLDARGGGAPAADPEVAPEPTATGHQSSPVSDDATREPFKSTKYPGWEYQPPSVPKKASFDAFQAAWDALLKGL